ncbi:MAG: hypothetical protein AAF402_08885 [Pseudomonadota bacterium]
MGRETRQRAISNEFINPVDCGDRCEHEVLILLKRPRKPGPRIISVRQALTLIPQYRPKRQPKFDANDRIQGRDIVPGTEEDVNLLDKDFNKFKPMEDIVLDAIWDNRSKPYVINKYKFCNDECMCLPDGKDPKKAAKGRGVFDLEVTYRVARDKGTVPGMTGQNVPPEKLVDTNGNNLGYQKKVDVVVPELVMKSWHTKLYRVYRAIVRIQANYILRTYDGTCVHVA